MPNPLNEKKEQYLLNFEYSDSVKDQMNNCHHKTTTYWNVT
jgi:hypothetical protein